MGVDGAILSYPSPTGTTFSDQATTIVNVDLESQQSSSTQQHPPRKSFSWGRIYLSIFKAIFSQPHETKCRVLEEQFLGYPRLATFTTSDPNFQVYRGFSYIHSRLLYQHQDELRELEEELDDQDEIDDSNASEFPDGQASRLQSRVQDYQAAKREGEERPRSAILADIHKKLLAYDELLLKAREVAALQRPSDRDYRSVRRYLQQNNPLVPEEQSYAMWREDLITLRQGRECAGFDGWIEEMLQKWRCGLTKYLFCTAELRRKTNDAHVHYYSPERVSKLVNIIITTIIFVLLVLPVYGMYRLDTGSRDNTFRAVGVLIVFTLLFSAAMSLLTRAQRHELFAAAAAYCAVLVVFISNFS